MQWIVDPINILLGPQADPGCGNRCDLNYCASDRPCTVQCEEHYCEKSYCKTGLI